MLNETFLKRMQDLLKDEYPAYLEALKNDPYQGFRINTLKIDKKTFLKSYPYPYSKTPFALNGYYTKAPTGIGWTPAYREGLFYMQEPSASAPVSVLNPKGNMKVLDMCAAPGSKSTEIAERLQNTGLLVANEYVSSRSDILLENIERCGTANAFVLNADTHTIAEAFPAFFDAVLVDAPCSGEGMFRKSESARNDWSEENVRLCAKRQAEILDNAFLTLNAGGTMVYSTCTFSLEENEKTILAFLQRHPQMHLIDAGVSFGRKGIDIGEHTDQSIRIYPMDGGEGQFMAKMQKDGIPSSSHMHLLNSEPMPSFVKQFFDQMLVTPYPYYFVSKGKVYGGTNPFISCGHCHIKRMQVYLGEIKGNRFEPSHHFFTSTWSAFQNEVSLTKEETAHYMHGEEIQHASKKGWIAVKDGDYVIGGGKSDGKKIKNKYPKAFRTRSAE